MNEKQKYRDILISESLELILSLNNDLLELEKNPNDIEIINQLFRITHTLKGNASLDGLEKISSVAHLIEDIFAIIRDYKPSNILEYIDDFLDAADLLQELVEGISNNYYKEINNSKVKKRLTEIKKIINPNPKEIKDKIDETSIILSKAEIQNLIKNQRKVYSIECKFSSTDDMSNINAFIILNNLKALASFIKSNPDEKNIKNKNFETVKIIIESFNGERKIRKIINANCRDFKIDKLDVNLIKKLKPYEKKERSLEEIVDSILEKYSKVFINALKSNENVYFIELNYKLDDSTKGIMAYVIYNNLKEKSSNIVSSINPDEFKEKSKFTKILIYCSNKLTEKKIEKIIKTNCNSYTINKLSELDFMLQENITEVPEPKPPKNKKMELTEKTTTSFSYKTPVKQVYVEVDNDIVYGVIETIGEVVVNLNNLVQIYNEMVDSDIKDIDVLKKENKILASQLNATSVLCNSLMDYAVLLKLVPINQLFKKFPRIVRDSSKKVNKKIHLSIEGERTRIDQEIIDAIEPSILHIIRNSIGHGIEDNETRVKKGKPYIGTIFLRAIQVKNRISIEIEDDGRGIDKEEVIKTAIQKGIIKENHNELDDEEIYSFLFKPGFSTNTEVTNLSGRGVGMDVVATEMKKIGGKINIYSENGKGTKIILNLPITL